MAANTNKRIPIKHIRDRAKARYPERVSCAICDGTDTLELHHYNGLTNLLEKWQKAKGIPLDTDEQVLAVRDEFIAEHEYELYVAVVCLCAKHHRDLHKVYGKSPPLSTAKKQEAWVLKMRDKLNGIEVFESPVLGGYNTGKAESSPRIDSTCGGHFGRLIWGTNSFSSLRTDRIGQSWR